MSEKGKLKDDKDNPSVQHQKEPLPWKELLVLGVASAVAVTGLVLFVVYNHGEEFSSMGFRAYALLFLCVIVGGWFFYLLYLLDRWTGFISWSRDHINLVSIIIAVIVVAVVVGIFVYQAHKGNVARKNNILKLYQICDDEKAMLDRCQIEYDTLVEGYDSPVNILRVPLSDKDMSDLEEYDRTLFTWRHDYPDFYWKGTFDAAVHYLYRATYDVKEFIDKAWSNGKLYYAEDFDDAKTAWDSAKDDLNLARKKIDEVQK